MVELVDPVGLGVEEQQVVVDLANHHGVEALAKRP
jgi:hypothetical protein